MRDPDAALTGAHPEPRSSGSLLEQAGPAILKAEYVRARKLYTEVLKLEPHSIPAYLGRSLAHLKLAFPDLATGDAYKALLLVDMIREGEEEITPEIGWELLRYPSDDLAKWCHCSGNGSEGLLLP